MSEEKLIGCRVSNILFEKINSYCRENKINKQSFLLKLVSDFFVENVKNLDTLDSEGQSIQEQSVQKRQRTGMEILMGIFPEDAETYEDLKHLKFEEKKEEEPETDYEKCIAHLKKKGLKLPGQ